MRHANFLRVYALLRKRLELILQLLDEKLLDRAVHLTIDTVICELPLLVREARVIYLGKLLTERLRKAVEVSRRQERLDTLADRHQLLRHDALCLGAQLFGLRRGLDDIQNLWIREQLA